MAYLVSLFTFSAIITTMVIGWLGDRWNKAFLCSVGAAAAAMGMLGLILSQAAASLYTYIVGLAIMSGTAALGWALVGDLFGRRNFATLRGIMGVVFSATTFLSPIYAGWVFDRTGSYTIVLVTFSIILLLATSLFVVLGCSLKLTSSNILTPSRVN